MSASARILAAILLALAAVAAPVLAGDPSPIREHPGKPRVESVGDTTATLARAAAAARPSARDSSLAFTLRHASRTRLLLESAVRYEGDGAYADSAGIAFHDPELSGMRFAWRDIAAVEVSHENDRWLGCAIGGTVGFALGVFAAGPTLDEEGLVSGSSLDALKLVTYAVTAGLGALVGYEIGLSAHRWQQVYPP